jgi:hypothetical protein
MYGQMLHEVDSLDGMSAKTGGADARMIIVAMSDGS